MANTLNNQKGLHFLKYGEKILEKLHLLNFSSGVYFKWGTALKSSQWFRKSNVLQSGLY